MGSRFWLLHFLFVIGMLFLLAGCGTPPTPVPPSLPAVSQLEIKANPPIEAGKTAIVAVEAQGKNLKYEWNASRGTISGTENTALYTAPMSAGADVVSVKVSNEGGTTTKMLTVDIVAYTPTPPPPPTMAPSSTPVPSATSVPPTRTPVPTATAVPTHTPTNTPRPTPFSGPIFTEPFPQALGGQNTIFINNNAQLTESYPDQCTHTGQYGLKLVYSNMTGEANAGWVVSWENSPDRRFDASNFANLEFWVKGDKGGEKFQIGMKDTSEFEVKVESDSVGRVASDWVRISVPLSRFSDNGKSVNLANVRNVNLGFNRDHGPSGAICVDDIVFR